MCPSCAKYPLGAQASQYSAILCLLSVLVLSRNTCLLSLSLSGQLSTVKLMSQGSCRSVKGYLMSALHKDYTVPCALCEYYDSHLCAGGDFFQSAGTRPHAGQVGRFSLE